MAQEFLFGIWCSEQPLKVNFPELFDKARHKEYLEADHTNLFNGHLQWNIKVHEDCAGL